MSVLTGGIIAKSTSDRIGFGASIGPDGALIAVTGPVFLVSAVPPEGVVSANVGSLCIVADPAGASWWGKVTGSGSVGWVVLPTSAGSGKGNLDILQAYIDPASAAAITLGTLNVGDVVEAVEVNVYTAFDGTSPAATVGTGTSPAAFAAGIGLGATGLQTYDGGVPIASAETAKLYLSLGGSAAGLARVTLSVRRA
jgi:hypothetical protein